MVSETRYDIRGFDEDDHSLELPYGGSQGVAVGRMLGSFSDGLVFCKNRDPKERYLVQPYYIVANPAADAVNPSR